MRQASATKCGLDRLDSLPTPQPSSTLASIRDFYNEKKQGKITPDELKRYIKWFNLFLNATGIKLVKEITNQVLISYRDYLIEKQGTKSNAWSRGRAGAVNTICHFSAKEKMFPKQIRQYCYPYQSESLKNHAATNVVLLKKNFMQS
jgi:hypothetical protein